MSTIKSNTKIKIKRKRFFFNNIDMIERVGNKLPHPITLFGIFVLQ